MIHRAIGCTLLLMITLVISISVGQILRNNEAAAKESKKKPKGYTLADTEIAGGIWLSRDSQSPYAALYSINEELEGKRCGLAFGINQRDSGANFAIVVDKKEVFFQIKDSMGEYHFVPVNVLLKLEDRAPKKKAPVDKLPKPDEVGGLLDR